MSVVEFPTDVFGRWRSRRPQDAALDADPRGNEICVGDECGTTFAWRGYNGLCGWCFEEAGGDA